MININCTAAASGNETYASANRRLGRRDPTLKSREPVRNNNNNSTHARLDRHKDMQLVDDTAGGGRGVYLRPSEQLRARLDNSTTLVVDNFDSRECGEEGVYYTDEAYARLGWSLTSADLNGDGLDDLIVGAPYFPAVGGEIYQNGAVFVVYGRTGKKELPLGLVDLERAADLVLVPPPAPACDLSARFGHAVAVLDLDMDGRLDIAVSAPSHGWQSLDYEASGRRRTTTSTKLTSNHTHK